MKPDPDTRRDEAVAFPFRAQSAFTFNLREGEWMRESKRELRRMVARQRLWVEQAERENEHLRRVLRNIANTSLPVGDEADIGDFAANWLTCRRAAERALGVG